MSDNPGRWTRLRHIILWCMYDWGNSAFPAVILSFVFAPYFLRHVATDAVTGEAQWGFAISASAIAIALLSPVLGAFADRSGRRRPWLGVASAIAILSTFAMWRVLPSPDYILQALILLAIANAAFELAYVFYNAMLPDVAPEEALGRVSGFGWGAGYLGSLAALGMVLVLFVNPDPPLFALSRDDMEHMRATPVFAAVWFLLFAAPIVLFGPRERGRREQASMLVRQGLGDLWATVKSLRTTPSIAWFLVAHMLFIDGVNTLFVFGPLIAVGLFGFDETEILLFGVTIYLAAGIGAFALGWLDDKIGSKRVLIGSITAMVALSILLMTVEQKQSFWVCAGALGIFFGPVQSSSRSLMVRLSPEDRRAKLFGIYALAGRATAPLGPAAVSWAILETGNQRAGIVVVAGLLAAGALLLLPVKEARRLPATPPSGA
jgi:UMF1 family MFS transporter